MFIATIPESVLKREKKPPLPVLAFIAVGPNCQE